MGNDLLDQFMDDAEAPVVPSREQFEEISKLTALQMQYEEEIEKLEQGLKKAKENLRRIQEVSLPEALNAVGLKSFTTSTGASVTVGESVYASIRANHQEEGFKWLESNGLSSIIKDTITFSFNKGESKLAAKVMAFATKAKLPAIETRTVHPATLNSNIKKLLESNIVPPEDVFSVAKVKKTKIKGGTPAAQGN